MTGLFARLGSAFLSPPQPRSGHAGAAADEIRGARRQGELIAAEAQPLHPPSPETPTEPPDPERRGRGPSRTPAHALEPAARTRPQRGPSRTPAALAVLCRPDDALPVGCAVALLLAARCGANHALVAAWGANESATVRAPSTGGARRLAATLGARGHDAAASGRLTVVRLAEPLREAAPEAVRVLAAAGDVPTAIVLAGPRDEAADALLRDQDGLVVAVHEDDDRAVAELALSGVAPLAIPAAVLALPPSSSPARAVAASGLAVLPPLRGAVEGALAALLPHDRVAAP